MRPPDFSMYKTIGIVFFMFMLLKCGLHSPKVTDTIIIIFVQLVDLLLFKFCYVITVNDKSIASFNRSIFVRVGYTMREMMIKSRRLYS
jgi:hypothetical protein